MRIYYTKQINRDSEKSLVQIVCFSIILCFHIVLTYIIFICKNYDLPQNHPYMFSPYKFIRVTSACQYELQLQIYRKARKRRPYLYCCVMEEISRFVKYFLKRISNCNVRLKLFTRCKSKYIIKCSQTTLLNY